MKNHMNSKKFKNNTTGNTGVYWNKRAKKWQVQIMINGESIYLGLFKEKIDAINKRKEAEIKYFGEFKYIEEVKQERGV